MDKMTKMRAIATREYYGLVFLLTGFRPESITSFYDVSPTTTRVLDRNLLVSEATSAGSVAGEYYNAPAI
jgi:hypothetical protein